MITKRLNEEYVSSVQAGFADGKRELKAARSGDPFSGEALVFSWEAVRDGEAELCVTLKKKVFIDSVVIRTSEKTALRHVCLYAGGALIASHLAETGKSISSHTLELSVGIEADRFILSFSCDFSELSILSADVYGSEREHTDIFPIPGSVCFCGGYIQASSLLTCTPCEGAQEASLVLADKLYEAVGTHVSVSPCGDVIFTPDGDIPADGYRLEVTDSGVTISASGSRGFVMGVESLIKLIGENGRIPLVSIEDAPFAPFRGVHLMVPSKEQMTFAKRLIKHVVSPLGYNLVILELAGLGMRFDSHPRIAEVVEDAIERSERGEMPPFPHGACVGGGHAVGKETLKEFIDYVRSFGIEVVPEIQSLSHVQFMTYTYPEIAELDPVKDETVDIRLADALPAQVYPHCYCPSNPRSYEILFDIIDEVTELFAPLRYVHIGHDEVYRIGVCPRCKGTPPSELFFEDVKKIYDYLAAKGIKTMMWSDMLQPVTRYKTFDAAKKLPRDIIMLDFIWYFHLDKDIEENLLQHGYRVAFGNLYSSHFPRFEERIRREGIIGGQISTWVSTSEEALQKEGKFYDIFMVSEMLWDGNYSHVHAPTYAAMISSLMPVVRERIKGTRYPSRLSGARSESLVREGKDRFVCKGDGEYASLVFSHALKSRYSRMPWKAQESVGEYLLTYADGSVERIAIENGNQVGYCGARPGEPLKNPLYRHNGYTASYECDPELCISSD